MARKRRRSNSQRRKPARSRSATREPRLPNAIRPPQDGDGLAARGSEAAAAVVAESSMGQSEANEVALDSAQSPGSTAAVSSAWPTRRKRSQIVDLPVQELDHIRGDLARIGLLSLCMVVILVALTIVLR